MSIYFLRHIRTSYNLSNKISGCAETTTLPDQSLIISSKLPVKFHQVYCSPLERCRKTLELLPQRYYDNIEFDQCLTERNVGILEGMDKQEAIRRFPDLFYEGKIAIDAQIPNGESISDVVQRMLEFAKAIEMISYNQDILVCSHNQTLKVLFSLIANIPITNDYWHSVNFTNGELISITDVPLS